ncbi:putative ABC transporter ATP-binding protein [[Clostridium] sordellii]|uniref:ABC transporter ATP-binding protein n=1 Tax=Paraclostridium sordellii TaxID=1505 RepID=UPI0005E609DA|nr:ABC transporter ATP-binding protein [Paeniclostridium sordellii]CEQ20877.1 putative ABC transporter ATP-binding protein [[Clostridium] sordellii] [Paeniclostridium sordellii]
MSILKLNQVSYSYKNGKSVLKDISMQFEKGKFYAILGVSGAGKSTLLSLLAGLDEPKSGKILFRDMDIKEKGYEYHRKNNISLVFQNYNLIDYLTPLENIRIVNPKASKFDLEVLGLKNEEINRNVLQLSGGQQQRVAIGRALVANSPIILADEPTGNLDSDTADEIIDILKSSAHEHGKCIIVVTHSKEMAKEADVVLRLKNRDLVEI